MIAADKLKVAMNAFHSRYCEGRGDGDVSVPAEDWAQWIQWLNASDFAPPLRAHTTDELAKLQGLPGLFDQRPKPTYDLCLIACSASKTTVLREGEEVRAEQLYTGQLFQQSLTLGRRLARETLILSAKHGVLHPNTELGTYNVKLPTTKGELERWAMRAQQSANARLQLLKPWIGTKPKVLLLLPKAYATIRLFSGWEYTWPFGPTNGRLNGLGIGEQKAWVKAALAEGQRTVAPCTKEGLDHGD